MISKKYDERASRSLDLRGMEQREEVRKQQESIAEASRGLRSALPESYRKIDLQKLKENDPAMAFFLLANRNFGST